MNIVKRNEILINLISSFVGIISPNFRQISIKFEEKIIVRIVLEKKNEDDLEAINEDVMVDFESSLFHYLPEKIDFDFEIIHSKKELIPLGIEDIIIFQRSEH